MDFPEIQDRLQDEMVPAELPMDPKKSCTEVGPEYSSFLAQIDWFRRLMSLHVISQNFTRALAPEEIETLTSNGNWCEDWTQVRLLGPSFDAKRIRRCTFLGPVVIEGPMRGQAWLTAGVPHPCGLYDSVVGPEVLVGAGALVARVGSLAHTVVATRAVVTEVRCLGGAPAALGPLELGPAPADEETESSTASEQGRPEPTGPGRRMSGAELQPWQPTPERRRRSSAFGGPQRSFGNGLQLALGPEAGSAAPPVAVYAEIGLGEVVRAALPPPPPGGEALPPPAAAAEGGRPSEAGRARNDAVAEYARRAAAGFSVVGPGAAVRGGDLVAAVFLGPGAVVEGAAEVVDCTLLSSPEQRTVVGAGAVLRGSLLQWGCRVRGHAVVEDSLLMEATSVENHAKVTNCAVGPDAGVAAGECHHCLLGPHVGFHHQSLLIAALWPHGRGNVAYGANVGSNHTGRAADQEALLGEGVFFGLSAVAKYPLDLSRAPYSLVAAGAALLPQRVAFPFSLLCPPARPPAGLPAGLNQLTPGWVLARSAYTVCRARGKFAQRSRARRTDTKWEVFRPSTVNMMIQAREAIRAALGRPQQRDPSSGDAPSYDTEEVLTEREVPGLGKNFATRGDLEAGAAAYTDAIRRYALAGLLQNCRAAAAAGDGGGGDLDGNAAPWLGPSAYVTDDVFAVPGLGGDAVFAPAAAAAAAAGEDPAVWAHQRAVLRLEYPSAAAGRAGLAALLRELADREAAFAAAAGASRARDAARAARVLGAARAAAAAGGEDAVVAGAAAAAAAVRDQVEELLLRLERG